MNSVNFGLIFGVCGARFADRPASLTVLRDQAAARGKQRLSSEAGCGLAFAEEIQPVRRDRAALGSSKGADAQKRLGRIRDRQSFVSAYDSVLNTAVGHRRKCLVSGLARPRVNAPEQGGSPHRRAR